MLSVFKFFSKICSFRTQTQGFGIFLEKSQSVAVFVLEAILVWGSNFRHFQKMFVFNRDSRLGCFGPGLVTILGGFVL